MNYTTHQTLMDQAEEFRPSYDLTTNGTKRETQKSLIDEEWSEFHDAYAMEAECDQPNEQADMVYRCLHILL